MKKTGCFLYTFIIFSFLQAQVNIEGTVYRDLNSNQPVDAALVYANGGGHVYTGKAGEYKINMYNADTICVYYQNKIWAFSLSPSLLAAGHFDIYLDDSINSVQSNNQLTPVFVRNSNYKADSIKTREEYEKIFDYRKTKINMGNNRWHDSVATVGGKEALDTRNKKFSLLNVTSLTNAIGSKKRKQTLSLQKRLVETEQSGYVEHVFTRALVEKYSGIHDNDSLHLFIQKYSPSYEAIVNMNELDVGMYIIKNTKVFRGK